MTVASSHSRNLLRNDLAVNVFCGKFLENHDKIQGMSQTNYEHIIVAGIRRLPLEKLREVADFVYFLRQNEENAAAYQQLIESDMAEIEASELNHLEEEFKDYEQLHPRR